MLNHVVQCLARRRAARKPRSVGLSVVRLHESSCLTPEGDVDVCDLAVHWPRKRMANQAISIGERRTFERELFELGIGPRADFEVSLPATKVDHKAAEPIFTSSVRTQIGPLLASADMDAAVRFNAANHPAISEIPLRDLRIRVANYIDQPTLEKALGATLDEATITAHLVHQFQQKCFRESAFHTGQLDEPTLDALGYVRHRGRKLNKVDSGAAGVLTSLAKAWKSDLVDLADLGADVTAKTWFSFVLDAPFLGLTATRGPGVHLVLMRQLRKAQRHLMSLPQYRGLTPVELGDRLLWDPIDDPPPRPTEPTEPDAQFGDRHRGMRRSADITTPMHPAGLAIDLAYRSNPWVGNATFKAVTANSATLVGGPAARGTNGLGSAELGKLGSRGLSTGEIYDEIRKWNGWLERYIALGSSDVDLRAMLAARVADGTPGIRARGETDAAMLARWRRKIQTDRTSLQTRGRFLAGRDPARGFLSLHRDLVIACRDHGCLSWGGCDFGNGSGDLMHFDTRTHGIGRAYIEERGGSGPSAHPCMGVAPGQIDLELKATKLDAAIDGKLWRLRSRKEGGTTAIFVPKAALGSDPVTILVWIHGDLICGDEGSDALALVKGKTFPFARLVADSQKPVVLVVPSMPWSTDNGWHALGGPKTMNAFLEEVRKELTNAGWSAAPTIGRVVLAGHSRAYVVLNALAKKRDDAQWGKGGLSKVTDVWLVDTTYGKKYLKANCDNWIGFLKAKPNIAVHMMFQLTSDTSAVAECIRSTAAGDPTIANLSVKDFPWTRETHCKMPREQLPLLLETL